MGTGAVALGSPKREDWGPNGAEYPGIHSICVDPRDSRHVSIAVSTGGVWITRDGGNTWISAAGMRAEYVRPSSSPIPTSRTCTVSSNALRIPTLLGSTPQRDVQINRRRGVMVGDHGRKTFRLWIRCGCTSKRSEHRMVRAGTRKMKSVARSTGASS